MGSGGNSSSGNSGNSGTKSYCSRNNNDNVVRTTATTTTTTTSTRKQKQQQQTTTTATAACLFSETIINEFTGCHVNRIQKRNGICGHNRVEDRSPNRVKSNQIKSIALRYISIERYQYILQYKHYYLLLYHLRVRYVSSYQNEIYYHG